MLVIDTNIWVSYLLMAPSPLGRTLAGILQKQPYALSDPTFTELAEVLMRPKFEKFVPEATRREILRKTGISAEWFIHTETIADCRDPKDNKFLELALTARASHILTGDEDLLCRDPFRGIRITSVSEFHIED